MEGFVCASRERISVPEIGRHLQLESLEDLVRAVLMACSYHLILGKNYSCKIRDRGVGGAGGGARATPPPIFLKL